jgi:pantoate--beta-alanine ligase
MQIHSSIPELRAALQTRGRIAFVPTMGNLHAGHMALMNEARNHGDCVVASIFVNRLQFGPNDDFDSYPRTLQADCEKLAAAGVDLLFAPTEAVLYPEPQQYHVEPPAIQHQLDGEFRPGHFRGVATVVLKLFNIVQPQAALFGKKDYQQLMVLRNMTRQLALPIEIVGGETVRAEDGLALSSRNAYLSTSRARRGATPASPPELPRCGGACRRTRFRQTRTRSGRRARSEWLENGLCGRAPTVRSAAPARPATSSPLVVLAASRLGAARLIDNVEIELASSH